MTNQFSFPTIGRTVSFGFIIVSIAALNLVAWGAPARIKLKTFATSQKVSGTADSSVLVSYCRTQCSS